MINIPIPTARSGSIPRDWAKVMRKPSKTPNPMALCLASRAYLCLGLLCAEIRDVLVINFFKITFISVCV